MEAKHTPGNWFFSGEYLCSSTNPPTGYLAFVPPKHEHAAGNRTLIAAAPDLLSACKAMLAAMPDSAELDRAEDEALAAVAKAEGR